MCLARGFEPETPRIYHFGLPGYKVVRTIEASGIDNYFGQHFQSESIYYRIGEIYSTHQAFGFHVYTSKAVAIAVAKFSNANCDGYLGCQYHVLAVTLYGPITLGYQGVNSLYPEDMVEHLARAAYGPVMEVLAEIPIPEEK